MAQGQVGESHSGGAAVRLSDFVALVRRECAAHVDPEIEFYGLDGPVDVLSVSADPSLCGTGKPGITIEIGDDGDEAINQAWAAL